MNECTGTVGVHGDNQKRAPVFWTEPVGFEESRRDPMGEGLYWLDVATREAQSGLVLYPKKFMPSWAELKPSLVFPRDGIDTTYSALKQKDGKFAKDLAEVPWGKFASFLDADRTEFGLRGRGKK